MFWAAEKESVAFEFRFFFFVISMLIGLKRKLHSPPPYCIILSTGGNLRVGYLKMQGGKKTKQKPKGIIRDYIVLSNE